MMEYEQLKKSCRGNGKTNCILCGYDPVSNDKNLAILTCEKCEKVIEYNQYNYILYIVEIDRIIDLLCIPVDCLQHMLYIEEVVIRIIINPLQAML